MRFSTKITYALRALLYLAKADRGSVSLAVIAKQEKLSAKYLEAIFADLKKAGLVKSVQGARGGYQLAKSPKQISVLMVSEAIGELLKAFHCSTKNGKIYCQPRCACGVNMVMNKVDQSIKQTLNKIKLSELIN